MRTQKILLKKKKATCQDVIGILVQWPTRKHKHFILGVVPVSYSC